MGDVAVEASSDQARGRSRCGYGGTLGFLEEIAGSPRLWAGQSFWKGEDRDDSTTLREPMAVRLLLYQQFAKCVSRLEVTKVLLHEASQAVAFNPNAMVSASPVMMEGLRNFHALPKAMWVRIETRWMPSGVNRFTDSLSGTWDPADARAKDTLVNSISLTRDRPRLFPGPAARGDNGAEDA